MRAMEESFMAIANSLDPDETPCSTASHCEACCLKIIIENISKSQKNPEISGNIDKNCWTAMKGRVNHLPQGNTF